MDVKKILFISLIAFVCYGQNKLVRQSDLWDTSDSLNTRVDSLLVPVGAGNDSVAQHRTELNAEHDTTTAMRIFINLNRDSLTSHNTRILAIRDSLNNIYTESQVRTVIGDSLARFSKIVYVKSYGTDETALRNAITDAGENGIVELEPGRVYTQTNAIKITVNGIQIRGNNATLKRGNQQYTTLSDTCSRYSTVINVDSIPSGWVVGDYLQVYGDSSFWGSNVNAGQKITDITGTTITLNTGVGLTANLADTVWAIGDKVRKIYNQFVLDQSLRVDVENLIFDGNRDNNSGNYYFSINPAISSYNNSYISRCRFINMPNECIIGNGFKIIHCYAENLNGSFVHLSGSTAYDKEQFYGEISGNLTLNTNQISSATLTGHSEGAITFSATAGRTNINSNYFFNGGEAVLGYTSFGCTTDGGTRDFIFTNNFCRSFDAITSYIYRNIDCENKPGHFTIEHNTFDSCGVNDWGSPTTYGASLSYYDSVKIGNNNLWGNTTWANVPIYTNQVRGFETTEEISVGDITATGLTVERGSVSIWNDNLLGDELYTTANAVSDPNGNEANDTTGWSSTNGVTTSDASDPYAGTYALKFTAGSAAPNFTQETITGLSANSTYKVSIWGKIGTGVTQQFTGWVNADDSYLAGSPSSVPITSTWTEYTYYVTPTSTSFVLRVYASTIGGSTGEVGDEVYIDSLSIQEVLGGNLAVTGTTTLNNLVADSATVNQATITDLTSTISEIGTATGTTLSLTGDLELQNGRVDLPTHDNMSLDSLANRVAKMDTMLLAFGIANPTGSNDVSTAIFVDRGITLDTVFVVLRTSAETNDDVDINIRWASNIQGSISNAFTSDVTVSDSTTGIALVPNTTSIPARSWIWLECTSETNTVNQINATIKGKNVYP